MSGSVAEPKHSDSDQDPMCLILQNIGSANVIFNNNKMIRNRSGSESEDKSSDPVSHTF